MLGASALYRSFLQRIMHIWQPFGLDFTRRQIPRIVGPLLAACSARAFGYIAVRPLPAKMSSVPWFTVKGH
ncbi:hypothetical protein ZWY2020_047773 [Hordeum vulgare]|nr:hypothetical protein ZWY2020_047773 [Hordeum vulgare]